jgi:hypothetical protein
MNEINSSQNIIYSEKSQHWWYSEKTENLRFSGTGGGGPVDPQTQAYIDRSMDAVKAGNDARFAEVLTKLDSINSRSISHWYLVSVVASASVSIVVVVLTIFSFASGRFDAGLGLGEFANQVNSNTERLEAIESGQDRQSEKLDLLIELLQE